jgi:catechol 2,3-dioxygenase
MAKRIDARIEIGHVHLKVADLDRAVAFYCGVLGFEVTQRMGGSAAFLSAGGYHHHIGLNTWESRDGAAPAPGTTGLYHVAIRYPDRASLGDALLRLTEAGIPLDGASDHGVSEALYLYDPDGNGIELYWDRPRAEWPRAADGSLQMVTAPLDLPALIAEAEQADALAAADAVPRSSASESDRGGGRASELAPMTEETRRALRDMRGRLLNLHKALLDDTKAAYEMDRGRIRSSGSLLQLVISDPWFAWLHPLSELVVRIDESIEPESPATESDAVALLDQVERLLTPGENGDPFARRYFEALQRQPTVVLAHAEVRRVIKAIK